MAISGADVAGDVGTAAAGGFNPVSIGLALGGLGLQLFGGMGQANVASQQAQISAQIAGVSGDVATQEQAINQQKQQQMTLEAQRSSLQNFRNVQQTKAAGLASAVSGGAEFSSSFKGAQASATSQGGYNQEGIDQSFQTGTAIFGLNNKISADKIQMANLQSQSALLGGQSATDQGLSSLGGALLKSGPTIGQFATNAGIPNIKFS